MIPTSLHSQRQLTPTTAHRILSSPRRATALQVLDREGTMTVSSLATAVAEVEADGEPSSSLRESVYNSLRQTHLPRLTELGLVSVDSGGEVRPLSAAKHVHRYATPVAFFGVSWAELYRALGVVGLCLVVAALADVPVLAAVDPLAPATITLVAFVVTSCCELWVNRRGPFQRDPGT